MPIDVCTFRYACSGVLPGLACVVGAGDVRLVVRNSMTIHGRTSGIEIEVARFQLRNLAPGSEFPGRNVVPGLDFDTPMHMHQLSTVRSEIFSCFWKIQAL
jgi:hypothetical protein